MSNYTPEIVAGAKGVGLVSTIGTILQELFGIDLQPLTWGLMGGFVGASLAPKTTVVRAVFNYITSSFLSTLFGTGLAQYWHWQASLMVNVAVALVAICFYPLIGLLMKHVASIFVAGLKKAGLLVNEMPVSSETKPNETDK